MSSDTEVGCLEFRILPDDGGQQVPVDLVIQGLAGMQHLIHLFALAVEGRTVRQRARISDEIREKFVLRCEPPKPGSFIVPCRVGRHEGQLFPSGDIERVTGLFRDFGLAAAAGLGDRLVNLVSDSRLRVRALSAFRDLAPPAGRGFRYEIRNGTGAAIALDDKFPARVESLIRLPQDEERPTTVTGRLDEIAFHDRRLVIFYAPKNRVLECLYSEDIEPMLFENRRDLIQVTGQVALDEDGHPKRITEVEQIQDVDLSPFVLKTVEVPGLSLRCREPLHLEPRLSESQQLLCVEQAALELDVFAPTRADVLEQLHQQTAVLWREFALEDDAALSVPAHKLKQALLAAFEEMPHAQG